MSSSVYLKKILLAKDLHMNKFSRLMRPDAKYISFCASSCSQYKNEDYLQPDNQSVPRQAKKK